MLLPDALNNLGLRNIIHVGAHELEEKDLYERLGLNPVIWFEANPKLAARYPGVICAALSDKEEEVDFNIADNGQSSSLLKMKEHKIHHPDVHEVEVIRVKTKLLDSFGYFGFDAINLDIQGAELMALRGGVETLRGMKAVYTEVNEKEVYEGCAQLSEMDEFLSSLGFTRHQTAWWGDAGWGDALYLPFKP